jgi:hypothetical protein
MLAIMTRLQLLAKEMDRYLGTKAMGSAEIEFRDMHAQQLESWSVGVRCLEEAVGRRSVPGIKASRRDLLLSLRTFKDNLIWEAGRSSMNIYHQKVQGKKRQWEYQRALDQGKKFLEVSRIKYLQEDHMEQCNP